MPFAWDDGESTGDPSVAILALALAPWPARRALKVEKIELVSRDALPSAVPSTRRETRSGKRTSSKKNVQSIPYSFPIKNKLLHEVFI